MSDTNGDLWPAVPGWQAPGRWPDPGTNGPGFAAPGRLCLSAYRWSRGHQGKQNSVVQSSLIPAKYPAHAADRCMRACVLLHQVLPADPLSNSSHYLKEGTLQSRHLRDDRISHRQTWWRSCETWIWYEQMYLFWEIAPGSSSRLDSRMCRKAWHERPTEQVPHPETVSELVPVWADIV